VYTENLLEAVLLQNRKGGGRYVEIEAVCVYWTCDCVQSRRPRSGNKTSTIVFSSRCTSATNTNCSSRTRPSSSWLGLGLGRAPPTASAFCRTSRKLNDLLHQLHHTHTHTHTLTYTHTHTHSYSLSSYSLSSRDSVLSLELLLLHVLLIS